MTLSSQPNLLSNWAPAGTRSTCLGKSCWSHGGETFRRSWLETSGLQVPQLSNVPPPWNWTNGYQKWIKMMGLGSNVSLRLQIFFFFLVSMLNFAGVYKKSSLKTDPSTKTTGTLKNRSGEMVKTECFRIFDRFDKQFRGFKGSGKIIVEFLLAFRKQRISPFHHLFWGEIE